MFAESCGEKFQIPFRMETGQIRKVTEKVAGRFEVLSLVKRQLITLKIASQELGLSYRHTRRLYKRFKLGGIMVLSFQRNHSPWNKIPNETRKLVIGEDIIFSCNSLNISYLF